MRRRTLRRFLTTDPAAADLQCFNEEAELTALHSDLTRIVRMPA